MLLLFGDTKLLELNSNWCSCQILCVQFKLSNTFLWHLIFFWDKPFTTIKLLLCHSLRAVGYTSPIVQSLTRINRFFSLLKKNFEATAGLDFYTTFYVSKSHICVSFVIMFTMQNVLLFFSILLSSLIMGLLYGYACSVNPGLNKLTDSEYLKAMQSINKEILNPFFFVSFIGTLIVLPVTTWYSKSHASSACFYLLLAATITYLAGVVGITAFGNIPLNNALAKFNILSATPSDVSKQRSLFEARWNRYHLMRTLFSILTTALAIVAVIKNGDTHTG